MRDSLAKIQVCVTFRMKETLCPSNLRSGVFVCLFGCCCCFFKDIIEI